MTARREAPDPHGSVPPSTPADPLALSLDIESLLPWARGIARGVSDDYGLVGRHEREELEGVAIFWLVTFFHRYDEARLPTSGDLVSAFQGAYSEWIRSECKREAIRLRTGGKHTKRIKRIAYLDNRDCGDCVRRT